MGWDMFDCVIPTREGRHGKLFFLAEFPKYENINITNAKFASDFKPINQDSRLGELRRNSRAFLHHLFRLNEPLGHKLASLNNLEFYQNFVENLSKIKDKK